MQRLTVSSPAPPTIHNDLTPSPQRCHKHTSCRPQGLVICGERRSGGGGGRVARSQSGSNNARSRPELRAWSAGWRHSQEPAHSTLRPTRSGKSLTLQGKRKTTTWAKTTLINKSRNSPANSHFIHSYYRFVKCIHIRWRSQPGSC